MFSKSRAPMNGYATCNYIMMEQKYKSNDKSALHVQTPHSIRFHCYE